MCICSRARATHCKTVLQNEQDKTLKTSLKKQSIMEHSGGLPKDTKPLRSCSGNRAMMLLKRHLGIKRRHSKYIMVIRLLQHSSSNSSWERLGCIARDMGTIIVLVLLAFSFIPRMSHHSITLPMSRFWDSATETLTPGDFPTDNKVESSA